MRGILLIIGTLAVLVIAAPSAQTDPVLKITQRAQSIDLVQIQEALELAAEFVRDPDEGMNNPRTELSVYITPLDTIGRLKQEIATVERRKLAAQKIREALDVLKTDKGKP